MNKAWLLCASVLLTAGFTCGQQAPPPQAPAKASENCANLPSLEKKMEALDARLKDWPELSRLDEEICRGRW